MIKVNDLRFGYSDRELYCGVSFEINSGEHAALIGSNGTGKTTLADMLLHPEKYVYKGRITSEAARPATVEQYSAERKADGSSVFEYLCRDFTDAERALEQAAERMDDESGAEEYQRLFDDYMSRDGYNHEVNIKKRLAAAGLEKISETAIAKISGGEYKLVQIIRAMLTCPDILVMDEPDTFLDFENLAGLRDLINSYDGTLLVITHSRYLLTSCFNKILHIENSGLREFEGTYQEYRLMLLRLKCEMGRAAKKESEWIDLQEQLVEALRKKATEVIDPDNGRALRARVSYLERLKKARTESPFLEERSPYIELPELEGDGAAGGYALRLENYSLAFDRPLLSGVSFEVKPGEKAALIGPNGTGKSTLLKELFTGSSPAAEINPEMKAYLLSQLPELMPDGSKTPESLVEDAGIHEKGRAEAYLERYEIGEDLAYRKAATLSGGEMNLLQLCLMSLGGADLLLLDEPTVHLDLSGSVRLEEAIKNYKGTVLLVSHDYYLITAVADYILLIEDGTVRRLSPRAFRKMMYKSGFNKDDIALEQEKKRLESSAEQLLLQEKYDRAEADLDALEALMYKKTTAGEKT